MVVEPEIWQLEVTLTLLPIEDLKCLSKTPIVLFELFLNFKRRCELCPPPPPPLPKSPQSCPTLWDPIDCSLPGLSVHGILQARTLEWVAISFSNAWKWKLKVKSLSCVQLLATPWTAAYQAPLSMGFSRQEYLSGCHCLLPNCVLDAPKSARICIPIYPPNLRQGFHQYQRQKN